MKKEKIFNTKFIAGTAILTAIEIVLYILGTLVLNPAGFNINLALIPILIGAIFFGPISGLFLGVINGIAVILTPETQAVFMNTDVFGDWCIFGTIVICLLKCALAGLASGYAFKLIKKKNEIVGALVAAMLIPIINTGIFLIGSAIFFNSVFEVLVQAALTFNFLIEIGIMIILSPAIIRIIKIKKPVTGDAKEGEQHG